MKLLAERSWPASLQPQAMALVRSMARLRMMASLSESGDELMGWLQEVDVSETRPRGGAKKEGRIVIVAKGMMVVCCSLADETALYDRQVQLKDTEAAHPGFQRSPLLLPKDLEGCKACKLVSLAELLKQVLCTASCHYKAGKAPMVGAVREFVRGRD